MRGTIAGAALGYAALALPACIVAGAGAGAAGAVYLTNRGAESLVAADVEATAAATERAFEDLGLRRTELTVQEDGARRQMKARPADDEDPDVTVTIRQEGTSSSRVEVTARTGPVTWDREYARRVLERIVELVS